MNGKCHSQKPPFARPACRCMFCSAPAPPFAIATLNAEAMPAIFCT